MRMSSSLMTWPLASSFLPPGRKTVQHRILPVETFTSTVCALIDYPLVRVSSAIFGDVTSVSANYREVVYSTGGAILRVFVVL